MNVDYVDHMGSDLTVVNAARVSFDKESEWAEGYHNEDKSKGILSYGDARLINYLAKHGHWTPFSHAMITIRETVPIFVARQRFKHMVGFTYNEVSRRYVDDEPEFYEPDLWRERPKGSVKQGSEGYVNWALQEDLHEEYRHFLSKAEDLYKVMLAEGVAPEQARMVLPQSMYTSYYVTGSLAAFARAYKLRIDPHSQEEIRYVAHEWNTIIQPLFPVSWLALTEQV